MTLLVFLAAAAGARIVASDLGLVTTYRSDDVIAARACGPRGSAPELRRSGLPRGRRARACAPGASHGERGLLGGVVHGHLRCAARRGPWPPGALVAHRAQPEEIPDDLFLDARLHVLE